MTDQITITVNGVSYVSEKVSVGKLIDFYRFRAIISGGAYGSLFREGLKATDEILLMIESEAFFQAFMPKFIEDLKPGSFRELSLAHYQEIKKVYVETIKPWLTSLEELLQKK